MIRKHVLQRVLQVSNQVFISRASSTKIDIKELEAEQELAQTIEDDAARVREEELEKKRNKSRLRESHYRFVHEQHPYPEPQTWHHGSLKYMRKSFGRYGFESGFDPALCWPVKEELNDAKAYERVAYPKTIQEMAVEAAAVKLEKETQRRQRQEDIVNKMKKLDQWKLELRMKIEKKENEATDAKRRRERLIEEVKRHFGYSVDPHDDRFKEMLEKKEKEQKKLMKEAKKKEKEEKLLNKIKKGKQLKTDSEAEKVDDEKQDDENKEKS